MPYTIKGSYGGAGISSYQLGRDEEWELLAVTFAVDGSALGGTNIVFCDYRDGANASIHRQPLGGIATDPVFFTLSTNAEPWFFDAAAGANWPQAFTPYTQSIVSQSIPAMVLAASCSLLVYTIPAGDLDPLTDPLQYVDPAAIIEGLHLWVEDTLESKLRQLPPPKPVGPYMLVPGPNA